mmetsp:Transcript_8512/g.18297  ORF Transcript_8512/g.18297 Transcript_8512/m.18297 type:complete len:617 (-) Transcript_8512:126-1976(-)
MKMLAGRRRAKPPRSMPHRQKGLFAGRGGPVVSRRNIPRYDHDEGEYYTGTGYYGGYAHDDDYTYEDRTYYTYDNEDTLCKQGNYRLPLRQAWQGNSCGLPSRLFFCADDASRDDVESEITDNVSNGCNAYKDKGIFASCLCFDQEFSFKVGQAKDENEKGKARRKMLLEEETAMAKRGNGRNRLLKYIPSAPALPTMPRKRHGREQDRLSPRSRMYDDTTYASMERSIDVNRLAPGRRRYDDATYASSMDRSLLDLGLIDDLAFKTYREMKMLQAAGLESDLPQMATTTLRGAKDQIRSGFELIQRDALRMGTAMEQDLHTRDITSTLQRSLSQLALDALAPPRETESVEEPTLLPEQLNGGGEKFDSSFQDDCGLNKIALDHRIYGVEVSDKGIAGGVTLHCEKDGHEEDDLSMTAGVKNVCNSDEEEELNIKSGCVKLCLTPRRQDDLEEDAIALHASKGNTNVTENSTENEDDVECVAAEVRDGTNIDPQTEEADTGAGVSTESTDAANLVAVSSKDADSVAVQRDDEMDPGEGVPTESSGAPTLPCEKDGHDPDDPAMISDLDDQDCTQQEVNTNSVCLDPCQKRKQDDPEEEESAAQVSEEGVIYSQASF